MEAREEDLSGLIHKITPPKLEDAGLEDCALPLHSIHEAFLKAASAVGSRVSHGGCVSDPPSHPPSDEMVSVTPPTCGPCSGQKGGALFGGAGLGSEDLVVGDSKEKGDDDDDVVVIGGVGSGGDCGGCVDGVKDLDINDGDNRGGNDDDDDDKDKEKKPILVEGFLFTP